MGPGEHPESRRMATPNEITLSGSTRCLGASRRRQRMAAV